MRRFEIEDEGTHFEVHLIEGNTKVGGALIDVDPLGVDEALAIAVRIGGSFAGRTGE